MKTAEEAQRGGGPRRWRCSEELRAAPTCPVEGVSGDLSRSGLLWCRGGGPREAVEDEGLPVLLGDRSARTKGSTGARGGVARRGR
jgi:hypothetical protein